MKKRILFSFIFVFVTISFSVGQNSSEKIVITGVVVDVFMKPVPGAIIMIDGKKTNKSTDKNGNYKLKVYSTSSRIGIFTSPPLNIEEPIAGRTTINFTLDSLVAKEIAIQGDLYGEEEVNIGYGTEKRKNLTTSVSKVDAKQQRYASYNSIFDLLKGEVPGVVIDGNRVLIRENTSMMSSNEPLFVVDGTPVNSIDGLLPQMVHSVEVLKGSAASIYGSRGSNGVIIITLKNGKNSK